MTHHYKRHGTTTFFAGLDAKSGEVIGECLPRHRAKEFVEFLKKVDRIVAKYLNVYLVLDNYATYKTDPPRRLHQLRRTQSGHQGVGGALERRPQALRVDHHARPHHRQYRRAKKALAETAGARK